uniref:Uncharacterized protein n=1 Tax=Macaca fascicularis TaxID=9541 RepID=A0A7N9D1N0_MACFA
AWRLDILKLSPHQEMQFLLICLTRKNSSRVHVHNMQVCYICIHVPCWCAAPINLSFTLDTSYVSV